jgi:BirA family biotin operon repressor/biotin-[acetyl-CoA-carboxylase] ligase
MEWPWFAKLKSISLQLISKVLFLCHWSFMKTTELFSILDTVDSTNNYAMAKLHAGLAKHGMAWFALEQTAGKGQRGREWLSQPGENIALSVVVAPAGLFASQPFVFNMTIANACFNFLTTYFTEELTIKWPNDLYVSDRKAGGILIENIYQGSAWKWAVVGVGINVNQLFFDQNLKNPVSIRQETGKSYDTTALARNLHQAILDELNRSGRSTANEILKSYNQRLYKRNKTVRLKRQNIVFETNIREVNKFGQLLTTDSIDRQFEFGEVEWLL